MAKVKYYLRGESTNENIYLSLSIQRGLVLRRQIGKFINAKDWNFKNDKIKSSNWNFPKDNAGNKNLRRKLDALRLMLESKVEELNVEDIHGDWLKYEIDLFFNRIDKSDNGYSSLLIDNIQYVIDDAHLRENQKGGVGLSKSRIDAYKNTKRLVLDYQDKKKFKLKVADIDLKFKKSFLDYLMIDCGYKENYSFKILSNIKSVCNNAELLGIQINPQLRAIKTKSIRNDLIIYLSRQELNKIKNTSMPSQALQNAKKWLILGCNLGQRGGDLLNISCNDIKERNGIKEIELTQKKTNKLVVIPLTPEAESICDSGFPYRISIQKFNEYCKEVCRLSEINELVEGRLLCVKSKRQELGVYPKWKLISSHVCRRSYASNFYGYIPTALLIQVTGHSTEKMFLKYIGKKPKDHSKILAEHYKRIAHNKESFI